MPRPVLDTGIERGHHLFAAVVLRAEHPAPPDRARLMGKGVPLMLRAKGWKLPGWSAVGRHCMVFLGCFLVGSSRVDLQACKLEYSIVSPK